jgi:UDP-N-acetylmuramoyl-L-alanyl-D-glutamate--2,6-diaminopimelate ligase
MNSLAAATALVALGHAPREIAPALGAVTAVPGRFEPVDAGQPFAVIVDYAHTPDALLEVLQAGRGVTAGHKVHIVFGCGGDRDHHKRPEMGRIAAQHADGVVVTSDNPRSEDPMAIINDVIAGVPENYRDRIAVEPDRFRAIALALRAAGPGDVVIIAGKGHETTQTFHETAAPFDDRAVARELLENLS